MNNATALSTGVAAGRIAFGLGLMLTPTKFGGPWIGRAAKELPSQVAIRGLGVRDVALGAATIGTLKATGVTGMGFTVLTGLTILVDAVDVVSTAMASSEVPGKGVVSMAVAGSAAAAGIATLVLARVDAKAD